MSECSNGKLVSPLPRFTPAPPSLCVGSLVSCHELAASGGEQADQLPELVLKGTRHHGLPGRDLGFCLLQGGQGGGEGAEAGRGRLVWMGSSGTANKVCFYSATGAPV